MAESSYKCIMKSSAIIGGSAFIKIIIGMVRAKFVAILLGPAGVGLMGIYLNLINLITAIAAVGTNTSGVRQLAKATSENDDGRIKSVVKTLCYVFLISAVIGAIATLAFSSLLSSLTFKNKDYTSSLAWLSIAVFLTCLYNGLMSILQGFREIKNIAIVSIFGALTATFISIPCFYLLGQKGIVPSLILCALINFLTVFLYARKLLPGKAGSFSGHDVKQMFRLGVSFVGTSVIGMLTPYFINILMQHHLGLSKVGLYNCSYALSGLLTGFVLQAMGKDYFPRLSSCAHDNQAVRRIVNEQSEIALLLALPCIAGMIVFAPLLIYIFYSEQFYPAIELIRWNSIGILGRVISWPMGFILAAKAKGGLLVASELIMGTIHVGGVFWGINIFGLVGASFAFSLLYICHVVMMLCIMRFLVGGTWFKKTALMALGSIILILLIMYNTFVGDNVVRQWAVNLILLTGTCLVCLRQLMICCDISIIDLRNRMMTYVAKK